MKDSIVTITNSNLLSNKYGIQLCDLDTLVNVEIYPLNEYKLDIYRLSERDDDYENYCVDKDPTDPPRSGNHDYDGSLDSTCSIKIKDLPDPDKFECINRGYDGSLDLYLTAFDLLDSFWRNKDNDISKPVDRLLANGNDIYFAHTLKIFPSKLNGDYFCNERVLTDPKLWNFDSDSDGVFDAFVDKNPPPINEVKLLDSLNKIYNQVNINWVYDKKIDATGNYELVQSTSKFDDADIYSSFHASQYGINNMGESYTSAKTRIWLVDTLTNIFGFAPTDKNDSFLNTVVIKPNVPDWVISHEVGHAKFKLYHPDGSTCQPSGTDLGYSLDNLENHVTNDNFNLMNSGCIQNIVNTKISNFKIRRYQWDYIRNGK